MSKGKSTHHQNNSLTIRLSNTFYEIFSRKDFPKIFHDFAMISPDYGVIILKPAGSAYLPDCAALGRGEAPQRISRRQRGGMDAAG